MEFPLSDGPGPTDSLTALSAVTAIPITNRNIDEQQKNQCCAPLDWDRQDVPPPYPSIQDGYAKIKAEDEPWPKDEIREYIVYFMVGGLYVRPMGVFIGTKLEEFRDIIPYVNRRSNGEIGLLPYVHDFLLLSDHDYVTRVVDTPMGLYNVLILPSKEGRVFVMGESYCAFSFKSPSNIELKGQVAIGRFSSQHGLVEKMVKQHSLIQVDRGSLAVFVCDCKAIVLVPDVDCRMFVKIIDESLDEPQLTQVEILGSDVRPGAKYNSLGDLLGIIAKWKNKKKKHKKPQLLNRRTSKFKGIKPATRRKKKKDVKRKDGKKIDIRARFLRRYHHRNKYKSSRSSKTSSRSSKSRSTGRSSVSSAESSQCMPANRKTISQALMFKPNKKEHKIHARQLFDIKHNPEEERESDQNLKASIIVPRKPITNKKGGEDLDVERSTSQIAVNRKRVGEIIRVKNMEFTVESPNNKSVKSKKSKTKEKVTIPQPRTVVLPQPEVYKKIESKFFPMGQQHIKIHIDFSKKMANKNKENKSKTNPKS